MSSDERSRDTETFFNGFPRCGFDGVEELFVIRGGMGERPVELYSVFAYQGVKTQDFSCGAYVDFAREVKCAENGSHVPLNSLQGLTASRRALNGFEGFFQHG